MLSDRVWHRYLCQTPDFTYEATPDYRQEMAARFTVWNQITGTTGLPQAA